MSAVSTVWVTGVSGFIGINLARSLARDDVKVIGFGNRERRDIDVNLDCLTDYYSGGLTSDSLCAALNQYDAPQKIYHLAGGPTVGQSFQDPYGDFEKNVASAARLLSFVQEKIPETAIYISSSAAIFGDGYEAEIGADDGLNPLSPYGTHKVAMENMAKMYARTYSLKITIVRLFSVYGPELKKQLLWDVCSRLKAGENPLRLGGTGQERRDWCHVNDIVRYFQALPVPQPGECRLKNAGTSIATNVESLAGLLTQSWPEPVGAVFDGQSRAGDPFSLLSAADPELGFTWDVNVKDGVADYVAWFLSLNS